MSLKNFSSFYYGYIIDSSNNKLDFNEGAGELTATIDIGKYSMTELITAVTTALNAVSVANVFSITVSRTTRQFTITGDTSAFTLLLSTGSHDGTSIYSDMGFTGTADRSGLLTYESISGGGTEYKPQFLLQDYVSEDDFQEQIDATVNETASGKIEIFSFGGRKFIEMNIKFITSIAMDGTVIKSNPTGLEDARLFMQHIVKKGNIEFMPSINSKSTFIKVKLESTPASPLGTGYKLKEMLGSNLNDIYETGTLKFRLVEV